MHYLILDTETDGETKRKRFCDQLDMDHKVISIQLYHPDWPAPKIKYNVNGIDRNFKWNLEGVPTLIGHNLKFDLMWFWKKNDDLMNWYRAGGTVYDTLTVEYLLSGQNKELKYSLNDLSAKYGGSQKDDVVGAMFKAGMKASEIPKEILLPYAAEDVINTYKVNQAQARLSHQQEMTDIIKIYMNHYLVLCEIEANGMYFNKEIYEAQWKEQIIKVDALVTKIIESVKATGWPEELEFNPGSDHHVSLALFGGSLEYTVKVENGVYGPKAEKAGQVKYKSEKRTYIRNPRVSTKHTVESSKPGIYKTGFAILTKYAGNALVDMLIQHREDEKLLTTYYNKFGDYINPWTGCVHGSYNTAPHHGHASPTTGRVSCDSPNMQQLPKNQFLKIFSSRWGDEGKIVEFDFSQLEVRVLAYLSNDPILIKEVTEGLDLHRANAALVFDCLPEEVTKEQRQMAKVMTFQLTYGAGANRMASSFGIQKQVAEKFIDAFYTKYVGVRDWHENLKEESFSNVTTTDGKRCSYLYSLTGKRYKLTEQEFRGESGFSPTEYKNYPVQGTATDIFNTVAGEVLRAIYLKGWENDVLMINEIHDALLFDVKNDKIDEAVEVITEIMESVPKLFSEKLGLRVDVPFKVDYTCGKDWYSCKIKD